MKTFVTVVITAAITSLIWLVLFNLQAKPGTRTEVQKTVTTTAPPPPSPSSSPAPTATTSPPPLSPGSADDIAALVAKHLTIPVTGVQAAQLVDNYGEGRGEGTRAHEANDIMAAKGTPVVAVEDGRIAKLFLSKLGGTTIYQFDPTETYAYYYAHLDRYAAGLTDGQQVKRGQVIGYVGSTGDALESAPHLHFAITKLNADKHWWEGTPINPFHPLRGN